MRVLISPIIVLVIIFGSCSNKITEENLFPEMNGSSQGFVSGVGSEALSVTTKKPRKNSRKVDETTLKKKTDSDGSEYHVDENGNRVYLPALLPQEYVNRDFLPLVDSYDINDLTGGIVRLVGDTDEEKLFQLASLERYAKDTKIPEAEPIENGVIYNEKVDKSVNFSASYLIANLSVNDDRLKEIIVTDVSKANLKLGEFDIQRLREFYNRLPDEKKKNYFVIKSVVLTIINHRDFTKTEFKAGVDGQFFNAGGQTYSSSEVMKSTRTVSVDLVALETLFF
jgi:hypothetical protein